MHEYFKYLILLIDNFYWIVRNIMLYYTEDFFFLQLNLVLAGNEIWPLDRPDGMPTINSLEGDSNVPNIKIQSLKCCFFL